MKQKEIYIIRHGETDFNAKGIVQGRGVDATLNNKGRSQALAFYNNYRDTGFDKIYISTLRRTYETVSPFIDSGHTFEALPALDEIGWGIYEGMNASAEMKSHYKEIVDGWLKGNLDARIPDGESPLDLQQRQLPFIEHLKTEPFQKILVCSHGRAMRSLLCTMLNYDLSRMDEFPHQNLSLYKVLLADDIFQIELSNHLLHLQ